MGAEFATHKLHARRERGTDVEKTLGKSPLRKLPTKPKPPTKSRSQRYTRTKSKSIILMKKEDAQPKPLLPSDIVTPKVISSRKINKALSRDFPDEDPDLESEDEDNVFGIIKPKAKSRSQTISVLVPNREASDLVEL